MCNDVVYTASWLLAECFCSKGNSLLTVVCDVHAADLSVLACGKVKFYLEREIQPALVSLLGRALSSLWF